MHTRAHFVTLPTRYLLRWNSAVYPAGDLASFSNRHFGQPIALSSSGINKRASVSHSTQLGNLGNLRENIRQRKSALGGREGDANIDRAFFGSNSDQDCRAYARRCQTLILAPSEPDRPRRCKLKMHEELQRTSRPAAVLSRHGSNNAVASTAKARRLTWRNLRQ